MTVGEVVMGYEVVGLLGVGAPKNTPIQIISRLNEEIGAILADPQFKPRLVSPGGIMVPGTPAEFGKLVANETQKWAEVIRFAGIGPR
jgi:tripartite-type tricarboxylate transporter receptor subunit TctC